MADVTIKVDTETDTKGLEAAKRGVEGVGKAGEKAGDVLEHANAGAAASMAKLRASIEAAKQGAEDANGGFGKMGGGAIKLGAGIGVAKAALEGMTSMADKVEKLSGTLSKTGIISVATARHIEHLAKEFKEVISLEGGLKAIGNVLSVVYAAVRPEAFLAAHEAAEKQLLGVARAANKAREEIADLQGVMGELDGELADYEDKIDTAVSMRKLTEISDGMGDEERAAREAQIERDGEVDKEMARRDVLAVKLKGELELRRLLRREAMEEKDEKEKAAKEGEISKSKERSEGMEKEGEFARRKFDRGSRLSALETAKAVDEGRASDADKAAAEAAKAAEERAKPEAAAKAARAAVEREKSPSELAAEEERRQVGMLQATAAKATFATRNASWTDGQRASLEKASAALNDGVQPGELEKLSAAFRELVGAVKTLDVAGAVAHMQKQVEDLKATVRDSKR